MSFYDDASLVFLPSGGAGKDGKAYSIKPVPEYGTNLVTNGDFVNGSSNWSTYTSGSSNVVFSDDVATINIDGSNSNVGIYQENVFSSGVQYRIVLRAKGTSSFDAEVVESQAAATQQVISSFSLTTSYQDFVFTHTANGTNDIFIHRLFSASGANESIIIDNVSVKEVIVGDGDFTFSRGSNLTATRVDSNGLIEKGRENLLKYSNDFSQSDWTLTSGITLTSGQTGYDGSNDAWLLAKTATGAKSLRQYITQLGVVTMSIYAKAGTANWMRLTHGGKIAYFDLSGSGAIGTSSNGIDQTITSVGNGWFRCTLTANRPIAQQVLIYPYTAEGDASGSTDSIYIQSAQVEIGLIATEPILSGATTGLAGILEDSPRFDYSGGASCPSLLLEPSRTTILPYSEYFQGWHSDGNVSYSVNDATSPEGLTNAAKITATGTSGAYFRHTTSATAGDNTFSIFAKYDDCQYIALRIGFFTGGDDGTVWFDIQNGVKAGSDGSVMEYDIEDYGNGWYRCYVVHNVDAADLTGYAFVFLTNEDELTSVTNGTSNYFYGGQWEAGSYPTSYIPNHSGGSVTRNAEQIVNTNISSIVNTSNAYTIFFDFTRPNADYSSSWQIVGIDNGGYTSRLKIIQRPNFDQFRVNVYDGSTNVTSNEIDNSAQNKIAVVYDGGTSYKIFTNGTLLETLTCGAINGTRLISGENGTQKTIENHKQTLIFPTALSTTDCEILTGATSYESFSAMATALNYTTYE